MSLSKRRGAYRVLMRMAATLAVGVTMGLLSGCATHYVDGSTPGVDPAKFQKPAQPAPVQLLFEFETKGVPNARATTSLKDGVKEQVQASGLFSVVEDKAVPGGAMLDVKINNVPLSDDAFRKGFVTGLTFGLAGSQVSDGYICTVRYINGQNTVTKEARHAIHTTIGATSAPGNAQKATDIREAAQIMLRQILTTAFNELSKDPSFK